MPIPIAYCLKESSFNMKQHVVRFLYRYRLLIAIAVMTLFTHGVNLWGYPKFLGDEGVYTSQAWWLIEFGKLAPYTYWYDHAPLGWLQIGLWQKLTGGPFALGVSLFSTRLLMLVVAALTNVLVFSLTRELTKSKKVALFASTLFAFSPLSIYFHRQVLLDNLQTFWFLISLLALVKARDRLWLIVVSGLTFGIAFLSKETTLLFLPASLFLLSRLTKHAGNRAVSLIAWVMSTLFIIGFFPILAILKQELLPSSLGGHPHVSLWETILFQMSRGNAFKPWENGSYLRHNLPIWFFKDPLLMAMGVWTTIIHLFSFRKSRLFALGLMNLSFLAFLARGGLTLDFYIIPLLSLFPISIAASATTILKATLPRITKLLAQPTPFAVGLGALAFLLMVSDLQTYSYKATANQIESLVYMKTLLTEDSVVAVDDSVLIDLRLDPTGTKIVFPNVDWYSKIDADPEVREKKLEGDWRKINFILANDYILEELEGGHLPFLAQAFNSSTIVKEFPKTKEGKRSPWFSLSDLAPYAMDLTLYRVDPTRSALGRLL